MRALAALREGKAAASSAPPLDLPIAAEPLRPGPLRPGPPRLALPRREALSRRSEALPGFRRRELRLPAAEFHRPEHRAVAALAGSRQVVRWCGFRHSSSSCLCARNYLSG